MLISLIVPCYNEQEALPIFYEESTKVLAGMDCEYEFLFVNDGSKDATLSILKDLAERDEHVTYLSFSRNFGKEAAMYAGFTNAKGDYVAVMDADMQDPPALLPQMLALLTSGEYDSVATRRVNREGEPPIRSWFARKFYQIINRISDADIVDGARDFRLMKREMVDAIVEMGEYNRFSKGIFGWIGFRTYWLPYENVNRVAGETKWNFWKLLKYAIDGIINFSQGTACRSILVRHGDDAAFFYRGNLYRGAQAGVRRSGYRLGIDGVHHHVHRRRTAFLHGNYGAVYCKDLHGGKAAPALYCCGEQPRRSDSD